MIAAAVNVRPTQFTEVAKLFLILSGARTVQTDHGGSLER